MHAERSAVRTVLRSSQPGPLDRRLADRRSSRSPNAGTRWTRRRLSTASPWRRRTSGSRATGPRTARRSRALRRVDVPADELRVLDGRDEPSAPPRRANVFDRSRIEGSREAGAPPPRTSALDVSHRRAPRNALLRVAVIFEPTFDVVNPVADVTPNAVATRVAQRSPPVDRAQRHVEQDRYLVGPQEQLCRSSDRCCRSSGPPGAHGRRKLCAPPAPRTRAPCTTRTDDRRVQIGTHSNATSSERTHPIPSHRCRQAARPAAITPVPAVVGSHCNA